MRQIGVSFTLFAFVLGITLGFPDGQPRELGQAARSVHQLALVAVLACAALWVFVRGGRFKFTGVWYLENAILITAIVLLVEEGGPTHTLATALFLSAESFFYSFVFFTCYDLGRRTRRSAVFILGIFYSAALLAMGIGRLFSTCINALPGGIVTMLVIMSALVVVEMVMALHLGIFKSEVPLFSEVGLPEATDDPAGAPEPTAAGASAGCSAPEQAGALQPEGATLARIQELGAACGLTPVEMRIAELACRGWTRALVAAELGYSQNTVRNYTHTLYEKLGIHSKQELVELVEAGAPKE